MLCSLFSLTPHPSAETENDMEQESAPAPKKRLTAFGRTARRKRIFARLNEGWAYDEIAREERLTAHRVRQIVTEVLDRREVDGDSAHALLQLGRLGPAQLCRLASRLSHRCRIPRSVGSDEERRLHGERAQRERVRRHERLARRDADEAGSGALESANGAVVHRRAKGLCGPAIRPCNISSERPRDG